MVVMLLSTQRASSKSPFRASRTAWNTIMKALA
jgi:hypothetical protein